MKCSETENNVCEACFNWAEGNLQARFQIGGKCTEGVNTKQTFIVDSCKYYDGTSDGDALTIGYCIKCNNKDFLNIDKSSGTFSDIHCSHTAIDVVNCSKTIKNCDQSICYKTSTNSSTVICRKCNKGYILKNYNDLGGYESCAEETMFENCRFYIADSDNPSTQKCYGCTCSHAVLGPDETSCTSYNNDFNCRVVNSAGNCTTCWHSYYFDKDKCKLLALFFKGLGVCSIIIYMGIVFLY